MWLNCEYDGEPQPLRTPRLMDEFKRICSPLYDKLSREQSIENDIELRLCCSDSQMEVLKRDIMIAEAVVGNCPSCYLNFRMMWCHITCDPSQSDFILPKEYHFTNYVNLTQQLIHFEEKKKHDAIEAQKEEVANEKASAAINSDAKKRKKREQSNQDSDHEHQGEEHAESINDINHHEPNGEEHQNDQKGEEAGAEENFNYENDNNEDINEDINEENAPKRYSIRALEYYLSNSFALELIESCKYFFSYLIALKFLTALKLFLFFT
jgi:hypothetical protein